MDNLRPSLLKLATIVMTLSLVVACQPTPKYTREECDSHAARREYARECLHNYSAGHSYFIYSGGTRGGYRGGGYYSPVVGKPGTFAPVKSPSFTGRTGFGSWGRGGGLG